MWRRDKTLKYSDEAMRTSWNGWLNFDVFNVQKKLQTEFLDFLCHV